MKKKSFLKLLLVGALTLSAMLALVGCVTVPPQTAVTMDIASKDDFLKLHNYVGETYAGSVFNLKADIDFTGETYVPIGNLSAPFMGTIDGDGHRITGISYVDEQILPEMTGLVGAAKNAKFSNFTVEMKINQKISKNGSYLGAVAGASWGTLSIENVTSVFELNNNYETYSYKNPMNDVIENKTDAAEYAGGIVGYVNGGFNIKNVNVQILADESTVEKNESFQDIPRQAIFLGGVVGYAAGRGTENSIEAAEVTINKLSAAASTVYVGGVAGYIMNSAIDDAKVIFGADAGEMKIRNVGDVGKGSAGGMVGYAYQCKLQKLVFSNTSPQKIIWISSDTIAKQPFNFGGIVGYIENSELKDSEATFGVNVYGGNYFGGIAGSARGSKLTDVASYGSGDKGKAFVYSREALAEFLNSGALRICSLVGMVKGSTSVVSCASPIPAEGKFGTVYAEQDVDKDGNPIGELRKPMENGKEIVGKPAGSR